MFSLSFPNAEMSRSLKRSCSEVWTLLTDTDAWPHWGPSVRAVQCSDRFITQGTSGRIRTAAGIWLPFIITRFEEGRFWAWKVAGIPATGHRVEHQGKGLCRLTFEVPLIAAPYVYVCKVALDRISGLLE